MITPRNIGEINEDNKASVRIDKEKSISKKNLKNEKVVKIRKQLRVRTSVNSPVKVVFVPSIFSYSSMLFSYPPLLPLI